MLQKVGHAHRRARCYSYRYVAANPQVSFGSEHGETVILWLEAECIDSYELLTGDASSTYCSGGRRCETLWLARRVMGRLAVISHVASRAAPLRRVATTGKDGQQ